MSSSSLSSSTSSSSSSSSSSSTTITNSVSSSSTSSADVQTSLIEQQNSNVLEKLFRAVSECVENEIQNDRTIDSYQRKIKAVEKNKLDNRNFVLRRIVQEYPYEELRTEDREIFKNMCMRSKSVVDLFEDEEKKKKALLFYLSDRKTPAELQLVAQSVVSISIISGKEKTEIKKILKEYHDLAVSKSRKLRASVYICLKRIDVGLKLRNVKPSISSNDAEISALETPLYEEVTLDDSNIDLESKDFQIDVKPHCFSNDQAERLSTQYS